MAYELDHKDGLIPAHAGKTLGKRDIPFAAGAHPRSRGENVLEEIGGNVEKGSSPLTRGKRTVVPWVQLDNGLIPAHAGKTMSTGPRQAATAAHPRSRGENPQVTIAGAASTGSSPLTRGKPPPRRSLRLPTGLIPAHAGKTGRHSSWTRPAAAHPRSRGENYRGGGHPWCGWGSSPLTRGKRRRQILLKPIDRLIPAHAGKTACSQAPRPARWAHPRSRGENLEKGASGLMASGSSPLTRGKPTFDPLAGLDGGLIPAHAGKTHTRTSSTNTAPAHPRSRGENNVAWHDPATPTGSSPLTRGKLAVVGCFEVADGLIPAHAGKTEATP